jgi:hypothetical protein
MSSAPTIERDRWGRPLIIPPDGGRPRAYVRVSTMAKALDDLNGLMRWKQRKTAVGLLMRPDLQTRLAGVLANGNPDTDADTKRSVDYVCAEAAEAAGGSSGASAGTGFHSLTEAIDRGDDPLFVPPEDVPRLAAYRIATAPYRALASEVFVVNDALGVAGSFDRLWLCPDGRVRVGDLKTGSGEADYPMGAAAQMAMYVRGHLYDPETGERRPLVTDPEALDVTTGLLVHLPASGGCRVIPLDLERGWRVAQLAAGAYEARRWHASEWRKELSQ